MFTELLFSVLQKIQKHPATESGLQLSAIKPGSQINENKSPTTNIARKKDRKDEPEGSFMSINLPREEKGCPAPCVEGYWANLIFDRPDIRRDQARINKRFWLWFSFRLILL